MVSRKRRAVGAVFVSMLPLLVMHPSSARGEDVEQLVRQGVELRRSGKEQEALKVFQRALMIEKAPHVLAQTGLAEQALGLWVSAEGHLKEAVAAAADPWVKRHRSTLDESLEVIGDHLGTIEIWGGPSGAEVQIEGKSSGTLPATGSIRVPAGPVYVTVTANGFSTVSRTIDVGKRAFLREHVDLRRLATGSELAISATGAGVEATGSAGGRPTSSLLEQSAAPSAASPESFYKRWWFWTALGVVAAGGVVAAVVLSRGSACDKGYSCATWSAGN